MATKAETRKAQPLTVAELADFLLWFYNAGDGREHLDAWRAAQAKRAAKPAAAQNND